MTLRCSVESAARSYSSASGRSMYFQPSSTRPVSGAQLRDGRVRDAVTDRRAGHDQRDVQRCFVCEEPVRLFAVFAERFAVVREEDDGRRVEEPRVTQSIEEAAELSVREGDLVVVRVG